MKKLAMFASVLMLAVGLSFAQDTGDKAAQGKGKTPTAASGKKATKTSKAHKGGKKSKKGASANTGATTPK